MEKAKFAMAFHCHQPAFNFDSEVEKVYRNAYLPFLEVLEEFPEIKVSFHYSGSIIEWFGEKHPEYIDRVNGLLQRGQIELIGGGYAEPIMPIIPERDRIGQLKMNAAIVAKFFDIKTRGIWIAERVWEPDMLEMISDAGVEYVIVDDYHISRGGVAEKDIFKPYEVSGRKGSVVFFPANTRLRYLMPFQSPQTVLGYISKIAKKSNDGDNTCLFFADDGEKFGAWPHTHKLVYKKKWLRKFFAMLQKNKTWLETLTYSQVMDKVQPEKVSEIQASSYPEMMDWCDGDFKNFFKKYPEADRMQKRMGSVSDRLEDIKAENTCSDKSESVKKAEKELYKAQSGCAYWHGTFGGIYLPHLRSGVYEHLLRAQRELDLACGDRGNNADGITVNSENRLREIVVQNKIINVFVQPEYGAVISELDYKPLNVNLLNTIARHREKYHNKLDAGYFFRMRQARMAACCGELVDVHDVLGISEQGLKKVLFYDNYNKNSFITHVLKEKVPWKYMATGCMGDDVFLKSKYKVRSIDNGNNVVHEFSKRTNVCLSNFGETDIEVVKEVTVDETSEILFKHELFKHSFAPVELQYAVEFNFLIYDQASEKNPVIEETDRVSLEDKFIGVKIDLELDKRCTVVRYPIFTVNETEAGLKKTFQGVSVVVGTNCSFSDGEDVSSMKIKLMIKDT